MVFLAFLRFIAVVFWIDGRVGMMMDGDGMVGAAGGGEDGGDKSTPGMSLYLFCDFLEILMCCDGAKICV